MNYVVYLDVILVGNIVMNYVILWTTAKFAGYYPSRLRLLFGAAVGSIYAFSVFVPGLHNLLFWLFKLIIAVIMVLCTFAPLPWRRLLVVLAYFYLVSFGMGGVVMGLLYFMGSAGYAPDLSSFMYLIDKYFWYGIFITLFIFWLVSKVGAVVYHKKMTQKAYKTEVTIKIFQRQVQVEALVDTGNSLTDPFSGLPVMVVQFAAVKPILPPWLCELCENNAEPDFNNIDQRPDNAWLTRLRFIPYQSLGKKNGMLIAFQPDEIQIRLDKKTLHVTKALVAIYKGELSSGEGYRALLHPQLLKAA